MPVFNGGRSIGAALDSLLSQTFTDFELLVSDNASTDGTEAICREYAARDPRIRYVRQEVNLGAEGNFAYVMREATGKYFMWAAADDVRSPDFIALNHAFLESHPDYVASISPVHFEGLGFDEIKMGDRGLHSDAFDQRMLGFFNVWHANGAYYSLMRCASIQECTWVGKRFFGSDWAVVLHLARSGKLNRLKDGWVKLGLGGVSNSSNVFGRYRSDWRDLVAPLWRLTAAAMKLSEGAPCRSRMGILAACIQMNWRAMRSQVMGKLYRSYVSSFRSR